MRQVLNRLKRAALALVALVLPGCSREPSLKWMLDGRVEVPSAERQALATLFAGTRASAVELVDGDGLLGGFGARTVQVAGGRVVGVATSGPVPAEPLGALPELRRLAFYRSELESLEGLGPWPKLEDLRLEFTPLATLDGIAACCPGLAALSVSHGPIRDLGPLGALAKLERLRLDHSALVRLDSAPRLPSLKDLTLTSGPLDSLAGIESFPRLESLLLFGVRGLRDLSDLPALEGLREIELFQNGLTALSGLPALPSLERIETSDNEILSVRLDGLPKLRELEMHERDLLSVELGALPGLETVDLRGEGYLFKDGGRLRRLVAGPLPALESLDLRRNRLQDLGGLAPQPALRQVRLDRNPFDGLGRFADGFPSLTHVSVHRTLVAEIPAELRAAGLAIAHDPSEVEANMWEGVLREAFEKTKSSFVEELPSVGGSLRGHRSSCSLRVGTFSTPRLDCTGSIDRLSGLVHLPLSAVDPVSPAAGGPNQFPVRATIRTRKGVARVFLKYELDIRGRAEALAGYTDPERPWIEFGDTRREEDVVEGFVFAEARPGKPDSTSGEAHVLVDRLVVWMEGLEGAEGIEYVLERTYR